MTRSQASGRGVVVRVPEQLLHQLQSQSDPRRLHPSNILSPNNKDNRQQGNRNRTNGFPLHAEGEEKKVVAEDSGLGEDYEEYDDEDDDGTDDDTDDEEEEDDDDEHLPSNPSSPLDQIEPETGVEDNEPPSVHVDCLRGTDDEEGCIEGSGDNEDDNEEEEDDEDDNNDDNDPERDRSQDGNDLSNNLSPIPNHRMTGRSSTSSGSQSIASLTTTLFLLVIMFLSLTWSSEDV